MNGLITSREMFEICCWLAEHDFFDPKPIPGYSDVLVDVYGKTYKTDYTPLHQFNSNGYKQILAHSDETGKRRVLGVHQAVAMTFDSKYYDGCVVHHLDENKSNNCLWNLRVESNPEHARHHADPSSLLRWMKENGCPANKGKKMSPEFCEKCRVSAIKRAERERSQGITRGGSKYYGGNQFRNADGSKKDVDPKWYDSFRESCRKAALKREATKRGEYVEDNNSIDNNE